MPTKPWSKLNERPLPLTPIEGRLSKIGIPATFFRKPGTRHSSWTAFSLRPFYLSSLSLLSVCLLVVCEALRQVTNRDSGLLFFEDTSELSTAVFFAYNYVPTILAVLYVIAWSLVDLDTKRLEPYYQLSAHDTISTSILFLDYSFEPSLSTPFRALKRRHWTIVLVSSTFILVSLVLPPLQSSLIGITSVTLDDPITFQSWQQLQDSEIQSQKFTAEYVNHAYSIINDGASLPSFVTYEYAVSPFRLGSKSASVNETWTAETQVFWAQPSCVELPKASELNRPADRIVDNNTNFIWDFRNISLPVKLDGSPTCSLNMNFTFSNVIGLDTDNSTDQFAWLDLRLPPDEQDMAELISASLAPDCFAYKFFSFVFRLAESQSNSTSDQQDFDSTTIGAVVCNPHYFSAPALVTIQADNQSVVAVNMSGSPSDLGSRFAANSFENTLSPFQDNPNFLSLSFIDVSNLAITYLQNMGKVNKGPVLFQSNDYRDALEVVYKLIFVLALSDSFDTTLEPAMLAGSSERNSNALGIAPVFAIISEAILGIGTLVSMAALFIYRKRHNMLRSDPDSLSALCSLVADNFGDIDLLARQGLDKASTQSLKENLPYAQCHSYKEGNRRVIDITSTELAQPQNDRLESKYKTVYDQLPFFVTVPGFSLGIFALVSTIAGFGILLKYALRSSGFTYLAGSNMVTQQQLLWSFSPTLLATVVGAALNVVQRDLSVLEPWVGLRKGGQAARRTLSLRYASRPPVAILAGTFKNHHFLLLFISWIAISTNVLNIAMGGLFSESFTTIELPAMTFLSAYSPTVLSVDSFSDKGGSNIVNMTNAFEIARTNIADGTGLSPWTTKEFSLVPLTIPPEASSPGRVFKATTTGIGAYLNCEPLPVTNSTVGKMGISYTPQFSNDQPLAAGYVYWQAVAASQNMTVNCASLLPILKNFTLFTEATWSGLGALDLAQLLNGANNNYSEICDEYSVTVITSGSQTNANPIALSCKPGINIVDLDTKFDSQGYVTSHDRIRSRSGSDLSFITADEDIPIAFQGLLEGVASLSRGRNNTNPNMSRFDWPGLLMAHLDAMSPSRSQDNDVTHVAALASEVYGQVFSSYFSHSRDLILNKNGTRPQVQVIPFSREARMVPSVPLFSVTLVLLTLYIVALCVVMVYRRERYSGPRMPISVGSLIPWIAHSNMIGDFKGTHHLSSDLRDEYLVSLNKKYGFGWFRGTDNKLHLGLEKEPLLDRYLLQS